MLELSVLEYLEKNGAANTFRLARVLGIDRQRLLDSIKRLEAKGAVMVKGGTVQFLKYISEEKAISKPEKKVLPPVSGPSRAKAKSKVLQVLQTENKQLKVKLADLKSSMKELEKKASASPKTKIITRTIVKRVPVTKTVIKKIRSRPKIITRIVTRKVPVTKTIIKKIPVSVSYSPFTKKFTGKVWQKLKDRSPQFKISSKISPSALLKNLRQLKKPEFA